MCIVLVHTLLKSRTFTLSYNFNQQLFDLTKGWCSLLKAACDCLKILRHVNNSSCLVWPNILYWIKTCEKFVVGFVWSISFTDEFTAHVQKWKIELNTLVLRFSLTWSIIPVTPSKHFVHQFHYFYSFIKYEKVLLVTLVFFSCNFMDQVYLKHYAFLPVIADNVCPSIK